MRLKDIVTEQQLKEMDRRGFLKGVAATAAAGAVGSSMAQQDDPQPDPQIKAYLDRIMQKPILGRQAVQAVAPLKSPELTKAMTDIARQNPNGDVRLDIAHAVEQLYQQDLAKINQMSFK